MINDIRKENQTIAIAIMVFISILTSCSDRKFNVHLLDYGDCKIFQKDKNIFIKGDAIYTNYPTGNSKSNKFYHRLLNDIEMDSLEILITDLNEKNIKEEYHKHLVQYCYILDLSVSFGEISIVTSIHDTIVPEDISKFYNYLNSLSAKDSSRTLVTLRKDFFDDF